MMTVFLCALAFLALIGVASPRLKTATPRLLFGLQVLDVVLTLGLAALALWSYQS